MKTPVYLDYNASTPVDPRVVDVMLPYLREHCGNPSSKGHAFGWAAEEACELARDQMANLLGADPTEIVFTSCATESVNTAIKGTAQAYRDRRHLITVVTEHNAVLSTCAALEREGYDVTWLPVDEQGRVRVEDVEAAVRPDTLLIAVMWANNETGVLSPIREIARVAREHGILMMTDATQAIGKVPVSVEDVDLLACSAHKFYGPKGVGALYVRRRDPRVRLVPLLDGGGHERGFRSGTLNVPGIAGMGAAAEFAAADVRDGKDARMEALRSRLEEGLVEASRAVPEAESGRAQARINGERSPRMPQTTSIAFPRLQSSMLMAEVRDLAFSAGSACSSGSGRPSHVLKAMGLSDEDALSTLRLSLGRFTTDEEVDYAVDRLGEAIRKLAGRWVAA